MTQVGSTITGRTSTSQFGYSVDMNFAGDRIVASGIEYNSFKGYIGIWNLVNGAWVLYGSYIDGPNLAGKFGHSVSMNYAGTRIAVGAPDNKRVHIYDDTGSGFSETAVIPLSTSTSFGYAVSLAADKGLRIAIGAPDDGSGKVYIYQKTSNSLYGGWTLHHTDDGSDIHNNVPFSSSNYVRLNNSFNRYGHSVQMAAFGRHYIAGMPGTRKESYPPSDHSGTGTYNNIAYSSNFDEHGLGYTYYSNVPFYYVDPNYVSNARPQYQLRFPQYQVGYVRVKSCPDGGDWASGVTTVGGSSSTSSGNGGFGTIKGPNDSGNHIGSWNDYQGNSFGGFGSAVQISPKGDKISASAPGWNPAAYTDSHSGRILYYEYNLLTGAWEEGTRPNFSTFLQQQHGYALAMGTDASRIYGSFYDSLNTFLPYDYSGTEWYRAADIKKGASGKIGQLQGFSIATKSGDRVITGSPGMPDGGYTNRTGEIKVYEYPLTSVFRGNSLFEGYIKADEIVVGSTTNATNTKRLLFGGTKGDNEPNVSSLEVVHLGTFDDRDSEILLSKSYLDTSEGTAGSMHGSVTTWNDTFSNNRFLYGDRLRLKAPKLEFHIQPPNHWDPLQKYSESPVMTITNQDGGTSGSGVNFLKMLTNVKSCTPSSSKYAGLRLTSASVEGYQDAVGTLPADGAYYTFSPANDGWLRLYGGASGQGNMSGDYAGLAIGNLHVNGTISGPGAPSGGGSGGLNSSGVLDISKDGEVAKFQPATSGEYTLVNFNSKVNSGSDKGFILVQDETANSPGTSGEDLRMTIGVHNDFRSSNTHSDELWFQGGGRLCYNVGSWDSELNTIIGTPGAGTGHGGVKHEWRINNSAKMTLDSSGDLDVLGDINFTGVLTQNGTTYGSGGGVTGFGSVTGNYGTVQTTGSSAGGYDGYSIHGRYVFMSAGTMAGGNHQCGIFNELDNNWIIFFYRNTYARLFYNGAGRLETTNNGITVTGSTYNTSDDRIKYNEEEVINCVNIINQLTPVKYEKLNQPEDIVGTWIPTDDEWESKKSNYGWYNEFGFIAQDVRKIPGLDILVKGEETEEIEIIKTELEYNKFSEEMRTKYTYRPDTKDYIHNDSGPTQVPLTINYTGFIPIITGAVKELSSALEQEKQKTENLQTRLTASEQAYQALLERVVALESA
jgi:hypothetical protein